MGVMQKIGAVVDLSLALLIFILAVRPPLSPPHQQCLLTPPCWHTQIVGLSGTSNNKEVIKQTHWFSTKQDIGAAELKLYGNLKYGVFECNGGGGICDTIVDEGKVLKYDGEEPEVLTAMIALGFICSFFKVRAHRRRRANSALPRARVPP